MTPSRAGRHAAALLVAATAALSVSTANAADPALKADQSAQWGIGLGVGLERKPYRGVGTDVTALPLLMYESRWLSVFGPGVALKLPSAGPVSFRLKAQYSGDGYESDDSDALRSMRERKGGFWFGGSATWQTGLANLTAEYLAAAGRSDGQRFKLQVDRAFQQGSFEFTPRLAAKWADDKYVNYYYGVRNDEVLSNRPFYQGKSSVNVELGLRVNYALASNQTVFVDMSAATLGSGIKDSPIVDRSTEAAVRFGYLYRF
ncbi:MipA/OmpV family protein [Pigmentiphaga aceris]|uniref:MipA/OmpV family protein n=1 Tax=Pigmentiphaga aceris TaxID=1940612 RepID=A0A5C0AUA7_9BURK|nr:MipA/OmpV family protein [Pigmentiphaga aceris]QEI04490.1 MipA/OmpV family protein [Pigmentiphaga aceris]